MQRSLGRADIRGCAAEAAQLLHAAGLGRGLRLPRRPRQPRQRAGAGGRLQRGRVRGCVSARGPRLHLHQPAARRGRLPARVPRRGRVPRHAGRRVRPLSAGDGRPLLPGGDQQGGVLRLLDTLGRGQLPLHSGLVISTVLFFFHAIHFPRQEILRTWGQATVLELQLRRILLRRVRGPQRASASGETKYFWQ